MTSALGEIESLTNKSPRLDSKLLEAVEHGVAPTAGLGQTLTLESANSRPLVLVISQVYVPDPASVGQHMADAAEELAARGYRVVVVTSRRGYEDSSIKYPARELRSGVKIVRLPFSSFGKRSVFQRLAGQLSFLMQVIVRCMFARQLSGILVSTSPPMAGFAALVISVVRRVPITYWLMDLNPDQAIALGKARRRNPLAIAMRWLNRALFRRARQVIVLDRFMAERVRQQYRVGGQMTTLPPWPHHDCDGESAACSNPFRAKHNPDDKFIVMYSGNHSLASPVTTLLNAALAMQTDDRFLFMFIGGGHGKREVDEAIARRHPRNIVSLPYQPLEQLQFSLAAADLHVVTLGSRMVGVIHPCKIYGAMAVGRPVLLVGPRPSHAADLIDQYDIGWQVEHGDIDGVISAIRQAAHTGAQSRAECGHRARAAIAERFSKKILCGSFCDIVETAITSACHSERSKAQRRI
jgi:glycosyltransferase involved in cell wall biosynthesis